MRDAVIRACRIRCAREYSGSCRVGSTEAFWHPGGRKDSPLPRGMGELSLADGTNLHGRYRILRPIGRGGMGAVYQAVDTRLQNIVAVKQVTIHAPDADRAFEREAMLLAGLRHPALPVVIDYFSEDVGRFFVMQFIDGEDLARTLELRGGACDVDEVRAWAMTVLDALAYLHEHQPPIVHRDIKPANLKRTASGDIVLLDFGLAKGGRPTTPQPDDDQSLFGFTPRYAPPEQMELTGTDPRSDLYALGATLFHLLTGVQPPAALQRKRSVTAATQDPLPDLQSLNPRVPVDLALVVRKAMSLDRAERFGSAAEMRMALVSATGPALGTRSSPSREARRVDAAMPTHVRVSRPADLLVQVRFSGSPVLGLEDWPTRRRPEQIEQATESIGLTFPQDPSTGATLPARVHVQVVAPDFRIEGQSALTIDVPPEDYSNRLVFMLAPLREGYCRVNVVVSDPDAVHLGTIAVEANAMVDLPHDTAVHAATLVLNAIAVSEAPPLATPFPRMEVLAPPPPPLSAARITIAPSPPPPRSEGVDHPSDFTQFIARSPVSPVPEKPSVASGRTHTVASGASSDAAESSVGTRRVRRWMSGGALVTVLGVAGVMLWQPGSGDNAGVYEPVAPPIIDVPGSASFDSSVAPRTLQAAASQSQQIAIAVDRIVEDVRAGRRPTDIDRFLTTGSDHRVTATEIRVVDESSDGVRIAFQLVLRRKDTDGAEEVQSSIATIAFVVDPAGVKVRTRSFSPLRREPSLR